MKGSVRVGLVALWVALGGPAIAGCSSSSSAHGAATGATSWGGGGTSGGTDVGAPAAGEGGGASAAGGGTSGVAGADSAGTGNGSAGASGAGGAPASLPDVAAIMTEYHSYQPQSAEPEPVSAYIFALCRMPTLPEREFAESEHGDGRYLRDWANDLAVAGIAGRGAPPFAPGSVIVKEKYVVGSASGELELAALGIMIKREPGFAPARKDWDYAYWERDLGVISTAEQSTYCAGCHAGAADTDSVFVDGLVP